MEKFVYSIPTKIYFGKGQIVRLKELANYGSKVLLVYGGGSIKKLGIYDAAMEIMKENNIAVYELAGVEPNPRIESVRAGVEICKQNGIDMVLAIGGGSTIDCAKIVAAGACAEEDAWELVCNPKMMRKALPIFTVLTLAATGSEMDHFAVISNLETNDKIGTGAQCLRPVMSVLDPTYTYSVSAKQTSAGTADIISHTLESYFTNKTNAEVQARFAEGLLKTCFKNGPIALAEPDNYDARANLMWASSMAINGLISNGAEVSWCVHPMEHELSAFYDITHGEGLAILTPHWMDFALREETAPKFAEYGVNVWGLDKNEDDMTIAKKAIRCTRDFFKSMNLPTTLREVGIDEANFEIMAEKAAKGCKYSYIPLTKEDVLSIFKAAL